MAGDFDTRHPGAPAWPPSHDRIVAARAGDRDVLGDILSTGFPKLVSFYRGMGLTKADAEEVASQAIEGMVRNIGRLREPDAFEGWFWTIARNRLRSRLRVKGRLERELDYGPVADPESVVMAREEHGAIREALAHLSDRDRQVLWLREVEQLSHEEIGGRLSMKTGAVRVAVLRARRRLTEYYEQAAATDAVES